MTAARRFVARTLTACALCVSSAGTLLAATPSVIDPLTGASAWSYSDMSDATEKREGGYLAFNADGGYASDGAAYSTGEAGWYDQADFEGRGPHGGYDTTTNKCKACHAVHRAEGAYYLLRAATQDDACSYCHVGSAPYSSTAVYTESAAGVHTENGHTIGASAVIPDSTVAMQTEEVELVEGRPETTVTVRRYLPERKLLYRIVGSSMGIAGHPDTGGPTTYTRTGPTPLSCSSCHQVHAVSGLLWRPTAFDAASEATDAAGFLSAGYKLLRRFPGATVLGNPAPGAPIGSEDLAKVPESRLVADVNYSTSASLETTYTENGETFRQPDWVVNELPGGPGGAATAVNQHTLSVWCADCHNLNIGGGFAQSGGGEDEPGSAHSDRTHPVPGVAPFGGSASGGFQCYSCHRNDLGYGSSCGRCHYTTATYRQDIAASDFPHSGSADSHKLLGAFSIQVDPAAERWSDFTYIETAITEDNPDAVCLRCHAVRHPTYGSSPPDHEVPAEHEECTACHAGDAAEIHNATPSECDACHSAAVLTFDCGTCHPAELEPHGYEAEQHTATLGSGYVLIFEARAHEGDLQPDDAEVLVECSMCHTTDLNAAHGGRCVTCHPTPRDTYTEWNGSCQQGGCHPTFHDDTVAAHMSTDDPTAPPYYGDCTNCHGPSGSDPMSAQSCLNCHMALSPSDTTPPVTTSNAIAEYLGPALVRFSITDSGKIGVGTTFYRLDGARADVGLVRRLVGQP